MAQITVKHKTMKRPNGSDLIQVFEESVYRAKWEQTGQWEILSSENAQPKQVQKIEPIKTVTKKSCCGNK